MIAVSLSILWVLAYVAWRDWLRLKGAPNEYAQALSDLQRRLTEVEAKLETHELKLGLRRVGQK